MTACKYWDCGWCYAPNYLKTNAINSTCVNPYKCPISPLSEPVKYETPMTEIEELKAQIKVLEKKLSFLEELEKTKTPCEIAYKDWYGKYPKTGTWDSFDDTEWQGFQAGYEFAFAISTAKEVVEEVQEEPKDMEELGFVKNSDGNWMARPLDWVKSQSENEVAEGLRSAMRQAIDEGVIPPVEKPKESWMDKPIDELVDMLEKNPPDCLKFQLGKTLEQLIERWWCDVFTSKKYDWDMETAIQDLCDRVFLWLPKEQDSSGTQRIETIVAVDAHNELLRKIKSKLRRHK